MATPRALNPTVSGFHPCLTPCASLSEQQELRLAPILNHRYSNQLNFENGNLAVCNERDRTLSSRRNISALSKNTNLSSKNLRNKNPLNSQRAVPSSK